MNAQLPQNEKIKKSDYIIYNNTDINSLDSQVTKIVERLRY